MNTPLALGNIDNSLHQTNIVEMLNHKLLELKSDTQVPTEASFVDFIGYSIVALDQSVEQLKQYKATIQEKINQIISFKKEFLSKGAVFFKEQNYNKLEGIEISSITITSPRDESIEIKNAFESEYTKKEQEQILVRLGYGRYNSKQEVVPAKPAMLRINKRKHNEMPNFAELLFSRNLKQVAVDVK